MRYWMTFPPVWSALVVLGIILFLTACQTPTTAQRADLTSQAIVAKVCEEWRAQSYDSELDTPTTTTEAKSNNRAREAFCKGKRP